jgi:hypothetical protein
MRRHAEWNRMRCPRAWERTHPKFPGGAGAPPAGIRTGREELADGERCSPTQGAQSTDAPKGVGRCGLKGRRKSHRKRGPDAEKTPHGAPRGAARRSQDARRASQSAALWAPRGAPSPRLARGTEREGGLPGASNNTGDDACALLIPPLKGEGGSERSEEPGGVARASLTPPGRSQLLASTLPEDGEGLESKRCAILATPSENPKCPPRIGSHPRSAPPRASAR